MPSHLPRHKTVVSFVRRSSRMNDSQQRALTRLSSRYLVDLPRGEFETSIPEGTTVDFSELFQRPVGIDASPLVVEIGSGAGEAFIARAAAHPEASHVAFEVFQRSIALTMMRAEAAGIDNIRIIAADGVQGLERLIPSGFISELHILFPDPWHKKRHHKRRLINPSFASLASDRLADGATWYLATDWPDYAEQMRSVLDASPDLINLYPDTWAERPERPISHYEQRGLNQGRHSYELRYQRMKRTEI